MLVPAPASSDEIRLGAELQALKTELKRHGFKVIFEHPKDKRAYGSFEISSKTLRISPLAFALGIGRHVFIHEAIHAAQSCPRGVLTPIGLKTQAKPVVALEVAGILHNNYGAQNRAIELEAFINQGDPNAVQKVTAALRGRCRRDPQQRSRQPQKP